MQIHFSEHAKNRMKQRRITCLDIKHLLKYPIYTRKSFEERIIIVGKVRNRKVQAIIVKEESYIRIITVM